MSNLSKASPDTIQLLSTVKLKYHSPRLDDCQIAVCFDDGKAFVKNKLNLGKLSKFSAAAKLWQKEKYDFCLVIPIDLWMNVLQANSREAYLDLMLTRLNMEYLPETVEDNGKKQKVVDDFGRIQYSNIPKTDKEGNVKWKIDSLDLEVFAKNVSRYGLWQEDLFKLHEAMTAAASKK